MKKYSVSKEMTIDYVTHSCSRCSYDLSSFDWKQKKKIVLSKNVPI